MEINSGTWRNPFKTNQALYLSMDPSGKYLVQKIHLQPTLFYVGVAWTNFQVALRTRASNSVDIAWHHLGSFSAWEMDVSPVLSLVLSWAVRLSF